MVIPARAAWQDDFDALLKTSPGKDQERLVRKVADARPDWRSVVERIRAIPFPDVPKRRAAVRTYRGPDGAKRPYVLCVPSAYDPAKPTPLIVFLHGGVMREKVIDDAQGWAEAQPFVQLCETRGWLCLLPLGDKAATWWDTAGMTAIRGEVRAVKQACNVDDDRVWLAGFSDGASGAYLHAMVDATDYAAIVALNGHVSGGSLMGGISAYLGNMANTPVYAVATTDDELFPAAQTRPLIEAAQSAGAAVTFKELPGRHEMSYWDSIADSVAAFLEAHPRNPHPKSIVWEASDSRFSRFRWLAIDRIGGAPASWQRELNPVLKEARVELGIVPDPTYSEGGVPVRGVNPGSPAADAGVKPGDILLRLNGAPTTDVPALTAARSALAGGGTAALLVRRDGQERTITLKVPPAKEYRAFRHEDPSAVIRASFSGNAIDLQTSRVASFRIYLDPDLMRLDEPLTVRVDGHTVYNARGEPDVAALLHDFLENRDRRLLYAGMLTLKP